MKVRTAASRLDWIVVAIVLLTIGLTTPILLGVAISGFSTLSLFAVPTGWAISVLGILQVRKFKTRLAAAEELAKAAEHKATVAQAMAVAL
jgi:hypothetical protein